MVAVTVCPASSVTEAVITCVPTTRVTFTLPVPSGPSRSEVHSIEAEISPSSASSAAPVKVSAVPSATVVSAGAMIVRVGGSSGTTVTVVDAEADSPAASTTEAVTVWAPRDSVTSTDPPVPSAPSRSELHSITPVRSPSSVSPAVPVKVTWVPSVTVMFAGSVMLTIGGVSATTTTTIIVVVVVPPVSVTDAVIV